MSLNTVTGSKNDTKSVITGPSPLIVGRQDHLWGAATWFYFSKSMPDHDPAGLPLMAVDGLIVA